MSNSFVASPDVSSLNKYHINPDKEKVNDLFLYFKDKCPVGPLFRHSLDKDRKCKKCGIVSNSEWKLTKNGINYYNDHVSSYEKIEIRKKIRGIFNKISLDNFDSLSEDLIKLINNIKTKTQVKEAAKQLFDQILSEKKFISTYASLCLKLTKIVIKGDPIQDMNIFSTTKNICLRKKYEKLSFIGELVTLAENEFNKYIDCILTNKKLMVYEKIRMINNMELIGELFLKKLIHTNIIHSSIKTMLEIIEKNSDTNNLSSIAIDDIVDSLCKLITVSGEKLDTYLDRYVIDMYFVRLDKIKLFRCRRSQFIIMDIMDLRNNLWRIKNMSSKMIKTNKKFNNAYVETSINTHKRMKSVRFR